MEVASEIEQEITEEVDILNEIPQDFRSEKISLRTMPVEMQYQENNVAEEQSETQDEVAVNKLNLKQQIDVQKLILDETKQYINIEEQSKIMKSAMEQQITKVQQSIQLLKQKIKDEKTVQRRAETERINENRKLLEIKNFTESTKEIVDVLRSYVEGYEQQMEKLKFAELQRKVLKEYEQSCQMINEKTGKIEEMRVEISNAKPEYNVAKGKIRSEFETMQNNLKIQEECLRGKLDTLLQKNQQLKDEISKIDQYLNDKQENELQSSTKMKEFFNSKMSRLEEVRSNSLRIQEMEFKRNSLLKSIEYSSSSIDALTEDVVKLAQETSAIETQLKILQKDTADTFKEDSIGVGDMQITDMEKEQQGLTEELQNMEKQIIESKKNHQELVMSNHEREVTLLKNQNVSTSLREELLRYQNLNNNDYNEIQKLKAEVQQMEEEIERKQKLIETEENEQISRLNTKEELQNTLEKLQQEIKDKNDQFNYQRNTLQVHLENKLKDLENKLERIERKNEEEKEKFIKTEAVNKKKNEQYNRLRHMYLMLKTSTSELKFSETKIKQSTNDVPQENIENIEAERTETSPKSILKSTGTTRAPPTPTKNVKFVGVPSTASSNSSEMVNANNTVEKPDLFEELKSSLVQRKRNRTFD